MQKKYMDISIGLPEAYQYSLNGGDTWISRNAGDIVIIDPRNITNGTSVRVRSSEDIEEIDARLLGIDSRLYKSFNIKNGKTLTTTSSLFKNARIGKLRANNINNVHDSSSMFEKSIVDSIFLSEMPSVTNSSKMFDSCQNYILSDISISSSHLEVENAERMFYSFKTKIVGDIKFNSNTVNVSKEMFSASNIEFFPYLNINLSIGNNGSAIDSRHAKMFYSAKSKYILEGIISESRPLSSTSNGSNSEYLMYDGNSTSKSFFGYSKLIYTGLTFSLGNRVSPPYDYIKPFAGASEMITPFKSVSATTYSAARYLGSLLDGSNMEDRFSDQQKDSLVTYGGHCVFDDWMEEIVELDHGTNSKLTGLTSATVNGYDMKFIFGQVYREPVTLDGYASELGEIKNVTTSADQVYGSRNGFIAYRNGTTVNIYKPDNTLSVSIEVPIDVISGNMSWNGDKIFLVYGDRYDTVVKGTQELAGSVRAYDTVSGSLIEVLNVDLQNNYELTGVWKPSDDSGWQLVSTEHNTSSGDKIYSSVQYLYNGVQGKKITLSSVVDFVGPNYWEDNEFVCVNSSSGEFIRCIGK